MLTRFILAALAIALVSAKAAEVHYHYHFDSAEDDSSSDNTKVEMKGYNSVCRARVLRRFKRCQRRANRQADPIDRNSALATCNDELVENQSKCAARRLFSADDHLSWCTIKASTARTSCLTRAYLSLSEKAREDKKKLCYSAESDSLAQCQAQADKEEAEKRDGEQKKEAASKAALQAKLNVDAAAQKIKDAQDDKERSKAAIKAADQDAEDSKEEKKLAEKQKKLADKRKKHADAHLTWCTFKASADRSACKTKAYFGFDKQARASNLKACENAYVGKVNACNSKHLAAPSASAVVAVNRLLNGTDKHRSWCTMKNSSNRAFCRSKAFFNTDAKKRKDAFDRCELNFNVGRNQCDSKHLFRVMARNLPEDKHASFCTISAKNAQFWCKAGSSLTWDKTKRDAKTRSCEDAYKKSLETCANNTKTTTTKQTQVSTKVSAN